MKKIGVKSNIIKLIATGAFLCFTLAACKNFLNAGNIKEEIEQAIYINNHECPVATVEEPAFSDTGVARNKTIIVSFTMPVDPQTFKNSYDIKDASGNSLKVNFMEPVWSEDFKIVYIYANKQNLIEIDENSVMDVYFTLSRECKTEDGLPVQKSINHKYRINSQTKSAAPVLAQESNAVRPKISYRNLVLHEAQALTEEPLTAANESLICSQNHINENLNLYVKGNDAGGGKIYAYITYKRIYNADGTTVKNPVEKEIVFDKLNDKLLSNTDADGYKYLNIAYNLGKIPDYQDGMYEFNIRVKDEYDNISEAGKKYFILCDTQLSKSSNAMIWNETPMFRQDFTMNGEVNYPCPYDAQVPTEEIMEMYRKRVQFLYLVDDIYYISPFGGSKQYIDKVNDFTILFSWGTDLEHLSEPVAAKSKTFYDKTGKFKYYMSFDSENKDKDPSDVIPPKDQEPTNYDPDHVNTYADWLEYWYWNALSGGNPGSFYSKSDEKIIYELPDSYYNYTLDNADSDVYLQAVIIDSVGNTNTIETVMPRRIDFYSYKVEEETETENNKKYYKITLNYSDRTANVTRFTNVPNKNINAFYRILYAAIDDSSHENPAADDYDTSALNLTRNCYKSFEEDNYSIYTDKNVIEIPKEMENGVDKTPNYVIYIQPNYQTNSLVNGMYTGQTFGPFLKLIIDPTVTGTTGGPEAFEIESVSKESAGVNTGLLNITVILNKVQEGVTYIPCYSHDPRNTSDGYASEYSCVDHCTVTKIVDSGEEKTKIEFTIINPLRAPIYVGEGGPADYEDNNARWDRWTNLLMDGLYDYECPFDVKFKILATKDGVSTESSNIKSLTLRGLEDDNIPPRIKEDMYVHDSRLDYDGTAFVFDGLILENEGHIKPYFKFYYTPYNGIWGSSIDVLSEEEIKSLPYGTGYYRLDAYIDGGKNILDFKYTPVVPVYGLEDGTYMFFGKIEDTQGNYSYVTLGKANIGTYKNKLEVETVSDKTERSITVNFKLAPGEEALQKTYINLQNLVGDEGNWYNVYSEQNALQKMDFTGSTATIVYDENFTYYEDCDDSNKRTGTDSNGNPLEWYEPALKNSTDRPWTWNFYRVTVQSFNENPDVKIHYGRPYDEVDSTTGRIYNPWKFNQSWEAGGDFEYNKCTDETVSYTKYFYLKGEDEDLSDLQSSFFSSNARANSNHNHIVNVFASLHDFGKDADEWERRGKLIKTHFYHANLIEPKREWFSSDDEYKTNHDWYETFFDDTVAQQDMALSNEKGFVYYAAVVHFADGSTAVSDTYTMNGY